MKVLGILYDGGMNGVSTFNYTLLNELKSQGHDCEYHILKPHDDSIIVRELEAVGIGSMTSDSYDMILVNNRTGAGYVEAQGLKSKRFLYFIHSIMRNESLPPISQDVPFEFFTFSEVAQDYLLRYQSGYDSRLIRNAIDMDRFPLLNNSSKLIQVLDLRNAELYINKFRNVAKVLKSFWIGDITYPRFRIEEVIKEAEVCVGLGRSAIEAMASGKQVIIYGVNGGDGLVTSENVRELARTNFSGWSLKTMPAPGQLTEFHIMNEVQKIKGNDISEVTEFIREEYCIKKNIKSIL